MRCPSCGYGLANKVALGGHKNKGPCKAYQRVRQLEGEGFKLVTRNSDIIEYFGFKMFSDVSGYGHKFHSSTQGWWADAWIVNACSWISAFVTKKRPRNTPPASWLMWERLERNMCRTFFRYMSALSEEEFIINRCLVEMMGQEFFWKTFLKPGYEALLKEAKAGEDRRWQRRLLQEQMLRFTIEERERRARFYELRDGLWAKKRRRRRQRGVAQAG